MAYVLCQEHAKAFRDTFSCLCLVIYAARSAARDASSSIDDATKDQDWQHQHLRDLPDRKEYGELRSGIQRKNPGSLCARILHVQSFACGYRCCLPGRLDAGIGSRPIWIGSGEPFRRCRRTSSPVIVLSTPAWLNCAVAPAGQSQGRSLLPVSITPVSSHFGHLGMTVSPFVSSNLGRNIAIGCQEYETYTTLSRKSSAPWRRKILRSFRRGFRWCQRNG